MSRTKFNNSYYFITNHTFLHKPYFNTDHKKDILLNQLIKIKKEFHIPFYTYSIVDNHYHALIYLKRWDQLEKIMQLIHGRSSYELNKQEKIERSIWGKYWSKIIEDRKSFVNILGYIIGNPLKHNTVHNFNELEQYKYCSFQKTKKELGEDICKNMIYDIIEFDFEDVINFKNWENNQ